MSVVSLVSVLIQGRGGKGSIYVFAAGNGGPGDTCAADGYTNSIYTIAVGSAGSDGRQSSFDEPCSGKMVVTFDTDPYLDTRHVVSLLVMITMYLFLCVLTEDCRLVERERKVCVIR